MCSSRLVVLIDHDNNALCEIILGNMEEAIVYLDQVSNSRMRMEQGGAETACGHPALTVARTRSAARMEADSRAAGH
jgi:hypothetical protein